MTGSEASPAWRRAFLRELARSGSVVRAAERGGVDKSSAYQSRRRNAAFAASWDRAQAAARERLGAACSESGQEGQAGPVGQAGPAEMPRPRLRLAGDETVRASRAGRPCIARVGPGRWSDAAEERFLAKLAATCNITAAAEAAGFSTTTLYKRRARWPGFAAEWDAAIDQGYARLEARLVELATDSLRAPDEGDGDGDGGGDGDGDGQADRRAGVAAPGPVMTVGEITNLLRLHRASARGGAPQNFAWRRAAPDPDAMRASILRKIEAIERAGERAGENIPDAPA